MAHESENLYTRRRGDGMFGLYSRKLFRAGQTIINVQNGDKQDNRDFRSIELDNGHYLHPDGMFTNHSCDPSAHIDKVSGFLIAAKQIWPNDEITFDYSATESDIVAPFECRCGATNCSGKIGKDND